MEWLLWTFIMLSPYILAGIIAIVIIIVQLRKEKKNPPKAPQNNAALQYYVVKNVPRPRLVRSDRVICSVAAVLSVLAAFAMAACSFFQARVAYEYVKMGVERYNSADEVRNYVAVNGICFVLTAASVIVCFMRAERNYLSHVNFTGLIVAFLNAVVFCIWLAMYIDMSLTGCMVLEILAATYAVGYTVATLIAPPDENIIHEIKLAKRERERRKTESETI